MSWFRRSPAVRMAARTVAVAVIVAAIKTWLDGASWEVVARAAEVAGAYAVLGLLTPLEPLVGNKTAVEVPSPPAEPRRP